jgi:hypothetical protein
LSEHRPSSSAPVGPPARHRRKRCAAVATDNKRPADGQQGIRSRTQWDAMTEVTNSGNWNATRMALLILARYGPRSAVGAALVEAAIRLIEALGHLH